ncbi:Major facilitator superfamily protein [Madurella fahalii]|uniref:Major facilitator superfamily protein n=1 Tax=Madurella fahalii TaxID=1157608 RepID=A0ABQ0G6I0_9PEZI
MASATASIPRFLLPQSGLIWRRVPTSAASAPRHIFLRLSSSSSKPAGQRVLEKPERFNPPSHGSRLPRKTTPRHYGGDLSDDEVKVQRQTDYPGMMAPQGTWAHWFFHSRWIHVAITVGTLSGLAIWTFALNFKHTSPFADMLPPASDYLWHPISSLRMLIEVLRLHEAHKNAKITEKRKRNVDDVAKRAAYRKAHGLPDEMGLFNQPMAKIKSDEEMQAEGVEAEGEAVGEQPEGVVEAVAESDEKGRRLTEEERQAVVEKVKQKRLGIW